MKKRKHHVGLIVTLTLVGLLIVAPVAAVFICFYKTDSTDINQAGIDEEKARIQDMQKFANGLLHDAMENTGDTGKMDFTFSQDLFNAFLSKINEKIPEQASQFIDRFYLKMDADYYHLVGNFHAYFFPTTAEFTMKFTKFVNEESPRDSYIEFQITNVVVGRIRGLKNVALWAAKQFNLTDAINSALSSSPLTLHLDIENAIATYSYEDFLNDVKKLIGGESFSNELYFQTMEEFVDNGMLDFDFETPKQMSMLCDIKSFGKQQGENHDESPEVRDVRNKVAERINTIYRGYDADVTAGTKPESLSKDNVLKLFHYFFHGYDRISDSDREAIDTIDMHYLDEDGNPWDKEGYLGFEDLRNGKDINQVVLEQTPGFPGSLTIDLIMEFVANPTAFAFNHPDIAMEIAGYGPAELALFQEWQNLLAKIDNGEEILHLYGENIDDFVKGRNDFLGYAQLVYSEFGDFDVNYVAMEDFYSVLGNGTADLNLGMSINGYEAVIGLHTAEKEVDNPYQISLDINSLSIGTNTIKSQLGSSLMGILSSAISGNSTFSLTVYGEESEKVGNVTFDFESSVSDEIKAALLLKNRKIDISLKEDETGVGYFSIRTAPNS